MNANKIIVLGIFVTLLGIIDNNGYIIQKEIKFIIGILMLLYGLYIKFKRK